MILTAVINVDLEQLHIPVRVYSRAWNLIMYLVSFALCFEAIKKSFVLEILLLQPTNMPFQKTSVSEIFAGIRLSGTV